MAPLDVALAQDVSDCASHLPSVGHIRRFVQMAGQRLTTPSRKRSARCFGATDVPLARHRSLESSTA
jgi:hypothetical protein